MSSAAAESTAPVMPPSATIAAAAARTATNAASDAVTASHSSPEASGSEGRATSLPPRGSRRSFVAFNDGGDGADDAETPGVYGSPVTSSSSRTRSPGRPGSVAGALFSFLAKHYEPNHSDVRAALDALSDDPHAGRDPKALGSPSDAADAADMLAGKVLRAVLTADARKGGKAVADLLPLRRGLSDTLPSPAKLDDPVAKDADPILPRSALLSADGAPHGDDEESLADSDDAKDTAELRGLQPGYDPHLNTPPATRRDTMPTPVAAALTPQSAASKRSSSDDLQQQHQQQQQGVSNTSRSGTPAASAHPTQPPRVVDPIPDEESEVLRALVRHLCYVHVTTPDTLPSSVGPTSIQPPGDNDASRDDAIPAAVESRRSSAALGRRDTAAPHQLAGAGSRKHSLRRGSSLASIRGGRPPSFIRVRSGTISTPVSESLISPGGTVNGTAELQLARAPDGDELPEPLKRHMSLRLKEAISSARRVSLQPSSSPAPSTVSGSLCGSPRPVTPRPTRHTVVVQLQADESNPVDETYTINQYVVIETIGEGKQGEVLHAYDSATNEMRAIKAVRRPPTLPAGRNALAPLQPISRAASPSSRPVAGLADSLDSDSEAVELNPEPLPTSEEDAAATPEPQRMRGGRAPAVSITSPSVGGGALECSPRAAGAAISVARLRARHSQFMRELALTEMCQSRHTMRLFEVINDPQHAQAYLVLEHFDGGSVAHLRSDGTIAAPLDPEAVVLCGLHMCYALQHIHDLGVVHRDVKPDNIFRNADGEFVLGDFGMAEELAPPSGALDDAADPHDVMSPERSHPTRGTLPFLAPEQLRSASRSTSPHASPGAAPAAAFRPSPAMDVWALGVTLYILLEGRLPWRLDGTGSGAASLVDSILNAPITFASSAAEPSPGSSISPTRHPRSTSLGASPLLPGVHDPEAVLRRLRETIRGMLHRDPALRWTTGRAARVLAAALQHHHHHHF